MAGGMTKGQIVTLGELRRFPGKIVLCMIE
jgi:hypothetical protein